MSLFKSLVIDTDTIKEEFGYLTDEQAEEVADVFKGYLESPDAWDVLRVIIGDITADI